MVHNRCIFLYSFSLELVVWVLLPERWGKKEERTKHSTEAHHGGGSMAVFTFLLGLVFIFALTGLMNSIKLL